MVQNARQSKAAQAWNLTNEIVLIGAGTPIRIPGHLDQCFPFQPHPEYRWLAEKDRPGSILAYDPEEGWTHFTPAVTEAERVWDGISKEPEGPYLEELEPWLEARKGRPKVYLGSSQQPADEATTRLRDLLTYVRRPKDEGEIALMERASKATDAGHRAAAAFIKPGVTEREIQIELETAMFRAGATKTGYASIVGTGPNSAVFHFTPGARQVQKGELVLIDAGAEVDGYVIDVTRTYPAEDRFTPEQQAIYDVVLAALNNANDRCRPGVEWLDIHRQAALDMAQGLVDAGVLRGSAESLVESEAIAMFFPHGIGHMVGLGVRDASGSEPGRKEIRKSAGVAVRCDMILLAGYTMTVEPGLYFIPALVNDPARREKFREQVNWERAAEWTAKVGGVRIEDNVLVTAGEPRILTAEIPK